MIRSVLFLVLFLILVAAGAAGGGMYVFWKYGQGLPDYHQLADYQPPVMTRVHAGDGRLMAEYAVESRVFVPLEAIPRRVIQAFLSAEDKSFYEHPGVDPAAIIRAVLTNVKNIGGSRRPVGASTITQQVAKNFLLSNEVSLERKIKEAILALRIEQAIDKNRILELYLNEIYLGFGSYGVAAAALNYFNKSLDELTIGEAAYLAGLPKAPNNYHPTRHPDAAKGRRDYVVSRLYEDGAISQAESDTAMAEPLTARKRADTEFVRADYFAEEVRKELATRYGEDQLYKGGLSVRTTLDPRLQEVGRKVLRKGIEGYDRHHGWRGPVTKLPSGPDWTTRLAAVEPPKSLSEDWRLAMVLELDDGEARVGFADGKKGRIPLAEMKWARRWIEGQLLGALVRRPAEALAVGDVVLVEPLTHDGEGKPYKDGVFGLRQMPAIEGALVAIDPHTGRVLAMIGGYGYERSQFNRALQAQRQPGSSFKPFVYLPALDLGYTPATLILDAPFVIDQGPGLPKWRPENYQREFYGPSTMRLGIEKSRNLMTVRLAQTIGMDAVADYAQRFGVVDNMPRNLSMALGATETTLLRLTTAYAQIVNGGKKIKPSLIDRIQDRHGKTVFRHDPRSCADCKAMQWMEQPVPVIPDLREPLTDPATAYQMVSMLQGVVERGTGTRIREVGKPLAGKTGTTNESMDTWFVGFSPDLAVGVFLGFDNPIGLGEKETGGSVAAPVFRDFMVDALKDSPATPFRIPPGIRLVRVDARTGQLAGASDRNVILEAFKPDRLPTGKSQIIGGFTGDDEPAPGVGPGAGTGGLY